MSMTGLEVFDTTLQKTNEWLDEIMDELALQDRHTAYVALRGTLHALRDRLPVQEAVHLGAQLPILVRGFYYEGWRPVRESWRANKKGALRHDPGRSGRAPANRGPCATGLASAAPVPHCSSVLQLPTRERPLLRRRLRDFTALRDAWSAYSRPVLTFSTR